MNPLGLGGAMAPITQGLVGLGALPFWAWLLLGLGLLWANARVGLPRAGRDLRWRGAGLLLFTLAAVLALGQGLTGAWPWPPQVALLCALAAPLAAGWALRRGRLLLSVLLGLSFPFFLLIALTAFFGLWLNLNLLGGVLLLAALAFSAAGLLLTHRTPMPAQPAWAGFQRGFRFGPGGFRQPGGPSGADGDVVDVEARTVDEPTRPQLPPG